MLERKILVIDDNKDIHEDFKRVLKAFFSKGEEELRLEKMEAKALGKTADHKSKKQFQISLEFASSGEQGIDKVREAVDHEEFYQLVFLDIRMAGGMDGIATLEKIWELDPKIEVVLCTAYSDYDFTKLFKKFGLTDQVILLKKPFDSIEVQQLALSLTTKWHLSRYNEEKLGILTEEVEESERELSLQRIKSMKAAKMASLGEMAAGVAHEINNPLTIIHGNADHILELIEDGSPECLERASYSARKIQATSLRISKVVKSLRNFARDGSGDPFEVWELFRVVEDTRELCNQRFYEKGVEFVVAEIPKELRIECRPVEISQVLLNLFNNSFDAIQDLKSKKIELKFKEEEDHIEFQVVDSGLGISSEIQEKIMQPFYTTKEVGKGTGLGLSISHGIIQSHGGEIFVDNSCENTCFVIRLKKKIPENLRTHESESESD